MSKVYFTNHFRNFFNQLEKNNHKEWFHANKKDYEQYVKKPFAYFVQDLIDRLAKKEQRFEQLEAKQCIGRINRDIRFSKDKTPYNIYMNAIITSGGKKAKDEPGIALRIGSKQLWIAGGAYMPEKEQLQKIRSKIANDPSKFQKLINAKSFRKYFSNILGDAIKRIPKEYQAAYEKEPLVANKQFYYVTEMPNDVILSKDLIQSIENVYKAAKPVNDYLTV